MSGFKVSCPFCSKTVSFSKYGKHLLSRCHQDEWISQFRKAEFLDASSDRLPFIKTKSGEYASCCFGCKTGYNGINHSHASKCNNRKQHFEELNTFFQKVCAETPAARQPGVPVETSSEEVDALKREVEALKKQLAAAEKKAADLEMLNEELQEEVDAAEEMNKLLPIILGDSRFYLAECRELAENIKNGKSKSLKEARGCEELLEEDAPAARQPEPPAPVPAAPAAAPVAPAAPVEPSQPPQPPPSSAHVKKSHDPLPDPTPFRGLLCHPMEAYNPLPFSASIITNTKAKKPGKQITLRD